MSYFSAPAMGSNPDMKKLKNYIMMLNQQLQYCFSNIDPDDNFSLDAMIKYQETDKNIAQLEASMKGFVSEFKNLAEETESSIKVLNDQIALKVKKEELCSEISMNPGIITFKTGYVTFDTSNFKLDESGSAEFSGSINGGSININNRFTVDSTGKTVIDSGAYTGSISCSGVLATETLITYGECSVDGSIYCNSMSVTGSVTCETLYEDSDRRLKENIEEIDENTALKLVMGLKPVSFRYKKSGIPSMGYIAQDVVDLQAEMGNDLPMTDRNDEGYYCIPYGNYGALYVGAIKAQQKQLDELERILEEENNG